MMTVAWRVVVQWATLAILWGGCHHHLGGRSTASSFTLNFWNSWAFFRRGASLLLNNLIILPANFLSLKCLATATSESAKTLYTFLEALNDANELKLLLFTELCIVNYVGQRAEAHYDYNCRFFCCSITVSSLLLLLKICLIFFNVVIIVISIVASKMYNFKNLLFQLGVSVHKKVVGWHEVFSFIYELSYGIFHHFLHRYLTMGGCALAHSNWFYSKNWMYKMES